MPCVENLTGCPRAFGRAPRQVQLDPGLNVLKEVDLLLLKGDPRFLKFEQLGKMKVYEDDEFERRIQAIKQGEIAIESLPVAEQVKLIQRISDLALLQRIAENTKSLTTLRACIARLEALRG